MKQVLSAEVSCVGIGLSLSLFALAGILHSMLTVSVVAIVCMTAMGRCGYVCFQHHLVRLRVEDRAWFCPDVVFDVCPQIFA